MVGLISKICGRQAEQEEVYFDKQCLYKDLLDCNLVCALMIFDEFVGIVKILTRPVSSSGEIRFVSEEEMCHSITGLPFRN